MKVLNIAQNTPEWLEARRGKIGGSDLGDIATERGNGVKIGVYKLLADRLAVDDPDNEDQRDRGHRLEAEALQHVSDVTGIEFMNGDCIWRSDDDPDMQVSPDGHNEDNTIAAEIKCLVDYKHLEACIDFTSSLIGKKVVLKDTVPSEYRHQTLQYFIINEKLERLFVGFYNPLVPSLPLHLIVIEREDVEDQIEYYKDVQIKTLNAVRSIAERLAF